MKELHHGMPLPPHKGYFLDKTEKIEKAKVVVFEAAPPLENMVIAGAGARGMVYPGAIIALEEKNIIKGLKRVGGSSAGALTAMMVGIGLTGQQILQFGMEVDLSIIEDVSPQHLGSIQRFANIVKNLASEKHSVYRGEVLVGVIRVIIQDRVEDAINKLLRSAASTEERDIILAKLISKNLITSAHPKIVFNDTITFGHIDYLVKEFPQTGMKQIFMTATNVKTKEAEIFCGDTTPDAEIAKMTAASMAIPGLFPHVEYKGKLYMDGGIGDNNPLKIFENRKYRNPADFIPGKHKESRANIRTFCLKAATDKQMHELLWTTKDRDNVWYKKIGYAIYDYVIKPVFIKLLTWLTNKVLSFFVGTDLQKASKKVADKIYDDYSERSIILYDEKTKMTEFDASRAKKKSMTDSSMKTINHWYNLYNGQLKHTTYEFSRLSQEQLRDLRTFLERTDLESSEIFHDAKTPIEELDKRRIEYVREIDSRLNAPLDNAGARAHRLEQDKLLSLRKAQVQQDEHDDEEGDQEREGQRRRRSI